MSVKYSIGAVNYRSGAQSTRKLLSDCVLDIYGGTPAAAADDAVAATKLARITVGSGTVTSTMRSLAQTYTAVMGNRTNANTVKFAVTVDGVGPTTYTYTFATAVDSSDAICARLVAKWLEESVPQIQCNPYGALSFAIKGKIDGLALTVADGSGTTAVTVTQLEAASRASIYTLQFGPPTAGVISKTSDVWSGVNLATGVATWFRFVLPTDDATLSTTQPRIQGTIGTSGADMIMANTTLTVSATTTIDTASITMPMAA